MLRVVVRPSRPVHHRFSEPTVTSAGSSGSSATPGAPAPAPALSAAEWTGVLSLPTQLASIREGLLDTPFSAHAIAALLLYGEPFGFTQQDVDDETQVAAYCAAMTAQHEAAGNADAAGTFAMLGRRHRERAGKIAALLPPPGTAPVADVGHPAA